MAIRRPKTLGVYTDLVDQAIFEVDELQASIEYDMEFMEGAAGFADTLGSQLKALLKSLQDNSYEFKDEDLPFMQLVNQSNELILPFRILLKQINDVHRQGLESE